MLAFTTVYARELTVGPGKQFPSIMHANAAARPGDVILVHPLPGDKPYSQVAIFVRQKNITFRAVPAKGKRWVRLSGEGFDYSGRGSTPRAMFQFNRGTDNCTLEGFDLSGAMNKSFNGAGVRINQANNVTIRNCNIHGNGMGAMSNGDGSQSTGVNQLFENCVLHSNGDKRHPGYNHNLYLGGTSVTLRGCEVYGAVTGHNVKSRAHYTRIEYSYIHDSANREFDLVDAKDTERPGSHAVLVGNIIVKDFRCRGNRAVIHFGQDGGKQHDGTIHLVHNTIVSPFVSPVVDLSTSKAKAHLVGNIICDGGVRQNGQKLVNCRKGSQPAGVTGTLNWFSGGFGASIQGTGLDKKNAIGPSGAMLFVDISKKNYTIAPTLKKTFAAGVAPATITIPAVPGGKALELLSLQYKHQAGTEKRKKEQKPTLGAYSGAP